MYLPNVALSRSNALLIVDIDKFIGGGPKPKHPLNM